MKRFITLTLALCMIISCFTVTSNAMAKKPKKYTKVKTATYQKYKKAYQENKTLKTTIANQKNEINKLKTSNNSATLSAELKAVKEELAETRSELDSANSMNKWVWSNLKSMGITYKSKTWTIPDTYPESFMVDGVKYIVIVPTVETTEGGE